MVCKIYDNPIRFKVSSRIILNYFSSFILINLLYLQFKVVFFYRIMFIRLFELEISDLFAINGCFTIFLRFNLK